MSESKELIAIKVKDDELSKIELIASQCSLEAIASESHFRRAFIMAAGIAALREAITKPILDQLLSLEGSPLGFKTDKDKEPNDKKYDPMIVKECAIEALLRGAFWCGNEFNIIAARAYLTREFFTRKLREYPGLFNLNIQIGAPVIKEVEKRAWVVAKAEWDLELPDGTRKHYIIERDTKPIPGTDKMIDNRIVCRFNSGMLDDAIIGKADRKIKAQIYFMLTGSVIDDGEADDADAPLKLQGPVPETGLNGLAAKIEQRQATRQTGTVNGTAAETKPAETKPAEPVADKQPELPLTEPKREADDAPKFDPDAVPAGLEQYSALMDYAISEADIEAAFARHKDTIKGLPAASQNWAAGLVNWTEAEIAQPLRKELADTLTRLKNLRSPEAAGKLVQDAAFESESDGKWTPRELSRIRATAKAKWGNRLP